MTIIGVDPGTTESALVVLQNWAVVQHETMPNDTMVEVLKRVDSNCDYVVLEQVESMGQAVGREVFETVFWTGRFFQAVPPWTIPASGPTHQRPQRLTRRAVKLHLCGTMQAKDANIRQALIDLYGATKAEAVGTKKAPGPLYGVSGHEWSALAVAVTWWDQHQGDGDGGDGVSQRSAAHPAGLVPGAQ